MSSSNLPVVRPSGQYYGIQLNNSEYRAWENIDEETSQLVYHWEKMDANIYGSLQDIMISVAKIHRNDENSTIKNMAKSIRQTKWLKNTDRIFGLDGQQIEKVGFISDTEVKDNQEVVLKVNWVSTDKLGDVGRPIFHEDAELQPLNSRDLQQIEKQFGDKLQVIYNLLPSGYDDIYEVATRLDRLEYEKVVEDFTDTPKEDKGGIISIFYGTNRNSVGTKDGKQEYGEEETNILKYGVCDVQLPVGHLQGELERPGKLLKVFQLPENEHIHIVLKSAIELERDAFISDFVKRLGDKEKQHALLFVHGYNTSFNEAAYRTAQLAWDIPFSGYAGFFSWPSAAKLLPYPADGSAARSSSPFLQKYIGEIIQITGLEQLHIIAHSMGGLALTLSLKDLAADPTMIVHLDKIFQLILGAPDIDQKEFRNVILPAFNSIGKRRTLYASDHDMALQWSSFGRSFRERLGQIGDNIFVASGLDSVEASNLKTPSNHSYMFESKILLSDLYFLITQGLPPKDRRLREISNSPVNYWLFPK